MGMIGTLTPIHGVDPGRPAGPAVSLEKLWHALHFLLTGAAYESDSPLADVILGGGDDEDEDEPTRVLPPDRVQALAAALAALTEAELRARFSPAKLAANDIYPDIWDEPEDDLWEEIWGYFEALRDAYTRAAAAGHGMRQSVG